ncbi:unnamed protein product [Symbiodinium pilosum]|uniref:Ubiquitin-like domain-containing protein n=1 Tax=Symbiodinium pilosum TaxID=2952 RepID=A0A812WY18_SYMPI|nr:unnamed protein product [Symbiodinium pilosum]
MRDEDEDVSVEVTINTITGISRTLQLQADLAVRDAKAYIERILPGFPAAEQQLLQGSVILQDDERPFTEMAQQRQDLLVLRQPRMNLKKFLARKGYTTIDDPADLDDLLVDAGRSEEPNVCLEIICHPKFGRFDPPLHPNNRQRANILQSLVQRPLLTAFENLVQHEAFGHVPGLLDEAAVVLHNAASAGLEEHCRCMLASPHFQAAARRKPANQSTALHHAASIEVLRTLLESPALSTPEVLNGKDRFGCTVLHYVTTEQMCRFILAQPDFSAINDQDMSGQTALHCAKNAGICEALLEHGALGSLSVADNLGRTALHVLSRNSAALAVLLRFSSGVASEGVSFDINALDKRGRSALHFATSGEACELLFQAGFEAVNALDDCGMSALHSAKNMDVVQAILAHPNFCELNAVTSADYLSDTALSRAASLHDSQLVLELLQHKGHDLQSLQKAADFAQGLSHAASQALLAARDEQVEHAKDGAVSKKGFCNLL